MHLLWTLILFKSKFFILLFAVPLCFDNLVLFSYIFNPLKHTQIFTFFLFIIFFQDFVQDSSHPQPQPQPQAGRRLVSQFMVCEEAQEVAKGKEQIRQLGIRQAMESVDRRRRL